MHIKRTSSAVYKKYRGLVSVNLDINSSDTSIGPERLVVVSFVVKEKNI